MHKYKSITYCFQFFLFAQKKPFFSYGKLIGLVCFGFMAYQPLLFIYCQILFYVYSKYMICKPILYIHTVKWTHCLISNYSILNESKLNGSKYCCV